MRLNKQKPAAEQKNACGQAKTRAANQQRSCDHKNASGQQPERHRSKENKDGNKKKRLRQQMKYSVLIGTRGFKRTGWPSSGPDNQYTKKRIRMFAEKGVTVGLHPICQYPGPHQNTQPSARANGRLARNPAGLVCLTRLDDCMATTI